MFFKKKKLGEKALLELVGENTRLSEENSILVSENESLREELKLAVEKMQRVESVGLVEPVEPVVREVELVVEREVEKIVERVVDRCSNCAKLEKSRSKLERDLVLLRKLVK